MRMTAAALISPSLIGPSHMGEPLVDSKWEARLHANGLVVTLAPLASYADASNDDDVGKADISHIISSYLQTECHATRALLSKLVDHILKPEHYVSVMTIPSKRLPTTEPTKQPSHPPTQPAAQSTGTFHVPTLLPFKPLSVVIPREPSTRKRRIKSFPDEDDVVEENAHQHVAKAVKSPFPVADPVLTPATPAPRMSPRQRSVSAARASPNHSPVMSPTLLTKQRPMPARSPRSAPAKAPPASPRTQPSPRPPQASPRPPHASPRPSPRAKPAPPMPIPSPKGSKSIDNGFVLPFAMPSAFRKEAWENREEISIPQWTKVVVPACAISPVSLDGETTTPTITKISSRGRQIKVKAKGSSIISHLQSTNPTAAAVATTATISTTTPGQTAAIATAANTTITTDIDTTPTTLGKVDAVATTSMGAVNDDPTTAAASPTTTATGMATTNADVEGESDSEEDCTDEKYFKIHAQCEYQLRRENLIIVNRVLKRKKASAVAGDDETPAKQLEKNFTELNKPFVMPPFPADFSIPVDFNYDATFSDSRPWKRPKHNIGVLGEEFEEDEEDEETEELDEESEEEEESEDAASEPRKRISTKVSRKGKAEADPQIKKSRKISSALQSQHHLALLKLRYLHLRRQLALLHEQNVAAAQQKVAAEEHDTYPAVPVPM